MSNVKVFRDQAQKEINEWLEFKKIGDKKREDASEQIEALVNAVVEGILTITEDKKITHALKFPLEGELLINKLEYKPRLRVADIHTHMNGIKGGDADGRVRAYITALTGQPQNVIKALDTEDYSIAQSIAIFFL